MSEPFNTTSAASTKTKRYPIYPSAPDNFGEISNSNPNLLDKILRLLPDKGPGGVAKGVYHGLDEGLFGILPSGNYKASSPEVDLGGDIGTLIDPFVAGKSLKGAAKVAVSGIDIGGKSYGTPLGRLLANSIKPASYNSKFSELRSVLTNPKKLKAALIDDIPQYNLERTGQDRIFAWRKKFGLGKPNSRYWDSNAVMENRSMKNNLYHQDAELGILPSGNGGIEKKYKNLFKNSTIDEIWNKFGKHTENGKDYYHYKKFDDYSGPIRREKHGLFGNYRKTIKTGKKKTKYDYYDGWDFTPNRSFSEILTGSNQIKQDKKTLFQRLIADGLTRRVEFKGSFKERPIKDIVVDWGAVEKKYGNLK